MTAFLQKAQSKEAVASEQQREKVIALLRESGIKLKSATLTALAAAIAKDPFKKVKQLIQRLIERLLREAEEEATHKGWCDMEMGKAKKERDFRQESILALNAELERRRQSRTS